jgi:hypothetical protein
VLAGGGDPGEAPLVVFALEDWYDWGFDPEVVLTLLAQGVDVWLKQMEVASVCCGLDGELVRVETVELDVEAVGALARNCVAQR